MSRLLLFFFLQAEDGIRDSSVTGVQTCALPIFAPLRDRGDELRPLIATIGVSVLLENAQLALFGPIPYQFDSPFARETLRIGRIFFSGQSVLVVAVSAAAIAA